MEKLKKRRLILFLCTGDICRSPMAVFYGRTKMDEKLSKGLELRGSGVMTVSSLLPAQETVIVMKEDNIDVTPHRSTKLTKELVKRADLILGMTPFHVQMAKRISDLAKGKTFLFMEYVEDSPKQYQIADPMGGTLETFKTTYKNIKKAVDKLLDMEAKGIYRKRGGAGHDGGADKSGAAKVRKRGRPRKEAAASETKPKTSAKASSKSGKEASAPKASKAKSAASSDKSKMTAKKPAAAKKADSAKKSSTQKSSLKKSSAKPASGKKSSAK